MSEKKYTLDEVKKLFTQRLDVLGLQPDNYECNPVGRYGRDGFITVVNRSTGIQHVYQHVDDTDITWISATEKDIQLGHFHKLDELTRNLNHSSYHKYIDQLSARSLATWQVRYTERVAAWGKIYDSVITFANSTLKILVLLNAGALIALLPILNNLTGVDVDHRFAPLQYYVGGVLCALFAYLCSYFAQYHYGMKKSPIGDLWRGVAIILGIGSALLFATGSEAILRSVMKSPTYIESLTDVSCCNFR